MTVPYTAWQRQRACERKVRHATMLDARKAVLTVWQRGEWAYYYACDYCSGWHLTSERKARAGKHAEQFSTHKEG